jgi:TRAP-type transport system small permease protein
MQNTKPLTPLARTPSLLKRAAECFLAITLVGMVLAVFINVILRYGFNTGIVFYEELSRLLFVWMVCIGAALVFAENEHLGFDMLTARLRGPARAVCRWLSRIAIAICLQLVIKGSWEQVIAGLQSFSSVMHYPLALVAAAALVMAVLMAIALMVEIVRDPAGMTADDEMESAAVIE